MARQTENPFPSWGDAGTSPPSGTDLKGGDNPKAGHYDYLWNELNTQFGNIITDFNNIDSDGDGVVDKANAGANPFTLDGNVDIPEGSAIRDGGGQARVLIDKNGTKLEDETGRRIIEGYGGNNIFLSSYSNQPLKIRDQEGSFTAVQYDTDASAGVLRTPNAGVRVESNGAPSSGSGLEFKHDGSQGFIRAYDADTSSLQNIKFSALNTFDFTGGNANLRLATGQSIEDGGGTGRVKINSNATVLKGENGGNMITLEEANGYVNLSDTNSDLRLATGQSIEDGGGTSRYIHTAGTTNLRDSSGQNFVEGTDGSYYRFSARANTPWVIRDGEGGFDAVKYTTSASAPGTLELTNADLDVADQSIIHDANSGELWGDSNDLRVSYDETGNELVYVDHANNVQRFAINQSGPVKVKNSNLRLATGQAIEDGGGTDRFELRSQDTVINAESGIAFYQINDGNYNRLIASNPTPVQIFDKEGGFVGVNYNTDPSTGTLELTNANLETRGTYITTYNGSGTEISYHTWTNGNYLIQASSGEIIGEDSAGNQTTLT